MNKLTEIKQCLKILNDPGECTMMAYDNAGDKLQERGEEWMNHLLSLLEEKDKALESAKEAIEHMLREQPNEMWMTSEVESWESIGTDTLKEIDKALTSSNNEGDN